ncbi:MAG: ketoacyl-ACP synthase III [Rickettsiaceae bacterium]|nr:MAG: ketoacyl-ACP synthase III [Rickettsiaceae bacterium]
MACKIVGFGSYLPERVISNEELALTIDTNDEWIKSRTGIHQRHIAKLDQYASHMAYEAAKAAIIDAGVDKSDIDLIIVCTTTPDNSFPSTATKLQHYLALQNIPSFDLQAVCSGFIYGLQVADSLISAGHYNNVLLVCSEKMSSLLDWQDRNTCVLFGDGAGAVILQKTESSSQIIDTILHSDGSYYDMLYTDGGVSMNSQSGKIRMQGPLLFKQAVEKMSNSITEVLTKNNINIDDVSYLVPHQANIRIIEAIANLIDIPSHKVIKTIATHANCSAASIPLALVELKNNKNLKKGDLIVFTAFGAGLTWGSAILRW